MTTNKELIERLEEGLGGVQPGMQRMEVRITDKNQRLEDTIAKLSGAFSASSGSPSHNNYQNEGAHRTNRDTGDNIRPFSSKIAKLEFPRFSGDDPTEWLNRVDQFFEFQEIDADQKGNISWEAFEDEVRARFGPPDSEDFDEALSRVRQTGTLQDYQREFERLGNRVRGWTQKALVGKFMGGLKPEVADGIRMFKPQSEDETLEEMVGVNMIREMSEIEEDDNGNEPEITLHALTGWTVPRTIRIKAIIGAHEVVALIDSGSTHNFISDRVAEMLRLPVKPTTSFTVRVSNGERFVKGNMRSSWFIYKWLETLGSVICDWKKRTMDFIWEQQPKKLQGIEIPPIQDTTLQGFTKDFRQRQAVFALYFQLEGQQNNEELSSDMQALLEYAYFQKSEIENQVQDMLSAGLIQPSTSPFSSPVLLVKKKDGTWRFCTDYRALNAATLDLKAGYHQIRVSTPDIPKTAFRTHNGHYEYLVMPFGLCNAPSTFQAIMNSIFRPYLRKFILVFFDDILIYSPTWEQHLEHVKLAFSIIRQHHFYVKMSKCAFGKQELETIFTWPQIIHHNRSMQPQIFLRSACFNSRTSKMGGQIIGFLGKKAGDPPRDNLTWRDGFLLYKGKVLVPADHSLRDKLLYEVYDSKPETKAPTGLLQPLPIPAQVWEDITLDFIEGLPNSHGKDTILVVVDRLSKFAHFIPLTHPFTAKVVAEKFIERVVKLHGMTRSIISDHDPIFISKFWQEFFKLSGSKLMLSSAYHPQTDGQTEVVNHCVEQYLRCFVHQWSREWSNYITWAEYWYNTTYHASIKMTPYQALYGRLPPLLPAYPEGLSPVHEVDQMLLHHDELLHQLKTNLEISMNRMRQQADSNRRDIQFKRGDTFMEESLEHWKHLPHEEATWESTDTICHQFPHLMLEDKHPLHGVGNDKPRRSCQTPRPKSRYID
ncbi:hypothetical protein F3Y22_tig00111569pilonHSYRG00069 [Hibiscus syriacus]|uniref:Integrase catalytic domain-containing protein n=1 Tax=Hibiscus syriacus TaxID=106335 RepID=A0A6A2YH67_HIBSY|nr:hypothetical protein F3Y22_tig00111569pilonHSYRG00069 [Hibiscus syriacus]